jgi:CRISPR-associated helicase Cas3
LKSRVFSHLRDLAARHDQALIWIVSDFAPVETSPIFARFMRTRSVVPQEGTVYLVCTSAGEVGIDISADHLICDLTPFDSMAQRFGRVKPCGLCWRTCGFGARDREQTRQV